MPHGVVVIVFRNSIPMKQCALSRGGEVMRKISVEGHKHYPPNREWYYIKTAKELEDIIINLRLQGIEWEVVGEWRVLALPGSSEYLLARWLGDDIPYIAKGEWIVHIEKYNSYMVRS